MPKTKGTAAEFILNLLRAHPDYEMQVSDIYEEGDKRWTKANISNALTRLLEKGLIKRTVDANRAAWWTIAD